MYTQLALLGNREGGTSRARQVDTYALLPPAPPLCMIRAERHRPKRLLTPELEKIQLRHLMSTRAPAPRTDWQRDTGCMLSMDDPGISIVPSDRASRSHLHSQADDASVGAFSPNLHLQSLGVFCMSGRLVAKLHGSRCAEGYCWDCSRSCFALPQNVSARPIFISLHTHCHRSSCSLCAAPLAADLLQPLLSTVRHHKLVLPAALCCGTEAKTTL